MTKIKGLKTLRKTHGLTQTELAMKIGVAQSTLAGWERGINMPAADKLPVLADLLDCTIDALYGREPPGGVGEEQDAS